MKVARAILVFLAALVLLAIPGLASAQGAGAVSGTISVRERVAIPANAVVTVQIAELPAAGRPAVVIAEQRFTTNGAQPPYRYSISYDTTRIDNAKQYTTQANISVSGQARYTTNTVYRVITQGAPVSNVNMVLVGTGTLPNTSGGTMPLVIAGLALLAAVAVFALRRALAARNRTTA